MATPERTPVLFSAKEALLPRLEALRADQVSLRGSAKYGGLLTEATLSLLLPEHTVAEQKDLRHQNITFEFINAWSDSMILLLIFMNPELPKPMLDKLRQKYPREHLKKKLVDSLDPRSRPVTWTVLMCRLLYPDAPDLDAEDGIRDRLVDRIIKLPKVNRTNRGDAAEMVLIHPELKAEFQGHFLNCIEKFHTGELWNRFASILHPSPDIIREAFNLEVLYGDTFEGLDQQGRIVYKRRALSHRQPLPERLVG